VDLRVAAGKLQTVLHCTVIGESDESEEAQMWNSQHYKMWSRGLGMAFLLGLFMFLAGCGREQAAITLPTLSSISPNSGAQGQSVSVTLTGSGFASGATINLDGTGVTASGTAVVSPTQITASFAIAANAPPVAQNVTVRSAGNTTNSQTFTVTGIAPTVSSTNPANFFDCEPINRKITAAFAKAMDPTTINAATFLVTGIIPVAGKVDYDATNNIAIFTPLKNLGLDTIYTATITTSAADTTGNPLTSSFSWSFESCATADVTAPTVTATVPANLDPAVPFNIQKITAAFSEGMDSRTFEIPTPQTSTTFTVVETVAGTPVTGTVTYAGNAGAIATFTPTSNLKPSTKYTATITAGATDLAGNALAGGGAPNPWTFTTGTVADTLPPAITFTVPADKATGVALNQGINATFSKAMDPTTISTLTFTVTGPGPGTTAVTGTVAYDVPTKIATFTPTSNLAPNATYTATISTGVKDVAGNALVSGAAPNPWTFTTGTTPAGPPPVQLGAAATFAGAGGGTAGITNMGTNSVVNGDIGTTGASTKITGFHDLSAPYVGTPTFSGCSYTETPSNIGLVNGAINTAPGTSIPTSFCPNEGSAETFAAAQKSLADAQTAYNALVAMPSTGDPGGNLATVTLAPGVWKPAGGSLLIQGGDLTLDAKGDANATFVFQLATTLTVGGPGAAFPQSVILKGGAQAKNVFWQVGSSATINAAGGGTFVGTIIAHDAVSISTAGNAAITTVNGRAIGLNAGVTIVNTVINVPLP
jgi:Ice-binding-like/Bacterial Ig-like domain/IPT/TIG domain